MTKLLFLLMYIINTLVLATLVTYDNVLYIAIITIINIGIVALYEKASKNLV